MPGPMMPSHGGFMGPMMNGQPGPSDSHFSIPNILLPGMNDSPLEFNMNKNKPPMPVTLDKDDPKSPADRSRRRGDKRDRDRERREDKDRRDDREKENNSGSNQGSDGVGSIPGNMWGGVMGMGYPVMGMNMIVDANMMGMNNYGMMQPIITDSTIIPQVSL